jgi:hypothetical protein
MDRPSRSTAPAQRTTVQGYCAYPSDHWTMNPCQMAALYTRSGTASGIVCERLDALQTL